MFILKSTVEQKFYDREVCDVAHDLIGRRLVRKWNGSVLAGIIIEAEAYRGEEDLACHAHVGKTRRNATMYVTSRTCLHYSLMACIGMLNLRQADRWFPGTVLLRSNLPTEVCRSLQPAGIKEPQCNGARSGKICQIGSDGNLNGTPLFPSSW